MRLYQKSNIFVTVITWLEHQSRFWKTNYHNAILTKKQIIFKKFLEYVQPHINILPNSILVENLRKHKKYGDFTKFQSYTGFKGIKLK